MVHVFVDSNPYTGNQTCSDKTVQESGELKYNKKQDIKMNHNIPFWSSACAINLK